MRFIVLCLLFLLIGLPEVHAVSYGLAEQDTVKYRADSTTAQPQHMAFLDSVAQATQQREQFMSDSLATMFISPRSKPARPACRLYFQK